MNLARELGNVVASQKEQSLEGLKFLLLGQVDTAGKPTGTIVVAADVVGAGMGETVLYATGSSARQTKLTDNRPCDAVVMAIVDSFDIEGEHLYKKGRDD